MVQNKKMQKKCKKNLAKKKIGNPAFLGVSQDSWYNPEFPISVRYPSPLSLIGLDVRIQCTRTCIYTRRHLHICAYTRTQQSLHDCCGHHHLPLSAGYVPSDDWFGKRGESSPFLWMLKLANSDFSTNYLRFAPYEQNPPKWQQKLRPGRAWLSQISAGTSSRWAPAVGFA